jgi:peptide-methionine (S)-S-oxide reductase
LEIIMRTYIMAFGLLRGFIASAIVLGLAGPSGAQKSTERAVSNPETTAPESEAKSASNETTKSSSKSGGADSPSASAKPKSERATFGAGCFWHVEAVFDRTPGVNWAVSGYAGGGVAYPSYEMVHEGITGHAEVVMVDYDPAVVSYEKLLNIFWRSHDPTTLNRQGPDVGTQYRSVIFYHNEEQRKAALRSYEELTDARVFRSPIVTQLMPMRAFYKAEDYHQDYYGGKPRAIKSRRKSTMSKAKKATAKASRSAGRAPNPASEQPDPDSSDAAPKPES